MPPRKVVTGAAARGGLGRRLGARPPACGAPRRARRPLRRRRLDGLARRRDAGGRAPAADRARPAHGGLNHGELGRGIARGGVPRGRLRAPLGPPLAVLPRQVPLRDAARPAAGRSARRSPPPCASTSRRRSGSPGRSSARSRSPPRRRSPAGLPFLIVRAKAKEYGTGNRIEGVFEAGRAASASSRTSSRPAERRSRRSRRCARRGFASERRSASSTARRAASTPSRARPCACGRSSGPPSSSKAPQIRMVERYPTSVVSVLPRGLHLRVPEQ